MTGKHKTRYCQQIGCRNISGEWQIEMTRVDGNWKVISIDIEGIEL
jgi:ABC-type transporter MlaC component